MRYQTLFLLLVLNFVSGCGDSGPPAASPADLEAAEAGVKNEAQLRFFLLDALQLSSLELVPAGGGSYTATGRDGAGMQYEIEITQQPHEIAYSWTNSDDESDEGIFEY